MDMEIENGSPKLNAHDQLKQAKQDFDARNQEEKVLQQAGEGTNVKSENDLNCGDRNQYIN